jgi:hypothetical protein
LAKELATRDGDQMMLERLQEERKFSEDEITNIIAKYKIPLERNKPISFQKAIESQASQENYFGTYQKERYKMLRKKEMHISVAQRNKEE